MAMILLQFTVLGVVNYVMLIVGLVKLFCLFCTFFNVIDAARFPFKRLHATIHHNSNNFKQRCHSTEKKSKSNAKPSSSSLSNYLPTIHFSSILTGMALSGAGFYYYENRDLRQQLERSQLLSGEIPAFSSELGSAKLLLEDPNFFQEAVKRGNHNLCLQILKKSPNSMINSLVIYDQETGQNLLVQLLEKEMAGVVDVLLQGPEILLNVLLAIDQMDAVSGKTPLLAAIQSKNYALARKLIRLGAKPVIAKQAQQPARNVQDFLKELQGPEAHEFKKEFVVLFGIVDEQEK